MKNVRRSQNFLGTDYRPHLVAWAAAAVFAFMTALPMPTFAQTFTVIHSFIAPEGINPGAGLTMDRSGNLYGTTYHGGLHSGGTVFQLKRHDASFTFSTLYNFTGGVDGSSPMARVVFGPNGILYGTTRLGGPPGCGENGCGVVFSLQPPPTICKTVTCYWREKVIYTFTGPDGASPELGDVIFDSAGNLYGTTVSGGEFGFGSAFELSPAGGNWSETKLHSFPAAEDGPWNGLTFDSSGNLYGTIFDSGAHGNGAVFQLTPSSSPSDWDESEVYAFTGGDDGGHVYAGLVSDGNGNFYGATTEGAGGCHGGTVFELSNADGAWNLQTLYTFTDGECIPSGPYGNLYLDAAGNLYGMTYKDGTPLYGTVFKLTRNGDGSWTQSVLHTFTGGDDGALPYGPLVFDANGNMFGTASTGGHYGHGIVFEITPN